jgi:hypothetical protein
MKRRLCFRRAYSNPNARAQLAENEAFMKYHPLFTYLVSLINQIILKYRKLQ